MYVGEAEDEALKLSDLQDSKVLEKEKKREKEGRVLCNISQKLKFFLL